MAIQRAHAKLYLEGIQVEFKSANVTEAAGSTSSCSITFEYELPLLNTLPRTLAHLFIWDHYDEQYKLFFEGELFNKRISRDAIGAGNLVTLNFQGLSNNWQYSWKGGTALSRVDIVTKKLMLTDTTRVGEFTTTVETEKEEKIPTDGLLDFVGPTTAPTITNTSALDNTLLMTLAQAFDKMATESDVNGVIFQLLNDISNRNAYYTVPVNCYRLHDRIFVQENEQSLVQIQSKSLFDLLSKKVNDISSSTTAKTLLNMLFEIMNFYWAELGSPTIINSTPSNIIMMPKMLWGLPPRCNVIFQDQQTRLSYTDDFMNSFTRTITYASLLNLISSTESTINVFPGLYAPTMKISSDVKYMDFTFEEAFKGNIPGTLNLAGLDRACYTEFKKSQEKSTGQSEDSLLALNQHTYEQYVNEATVSAKTIYSSLKKLVLAKYIEQKLATKVLSITEPLNLNRVVGLPAWYIEDKMPTMAGLLLNRNTTISADGIMMSQLTIGYGYIIWQESLRDKYTKYEEMPPIMPQFFDDDKFGPHDIGDGPESFYGQIMGGDQQQDYSAWHFGKETIDIDYTQPTEDTSLSDYQTAAISYKEILKSLAEQIHKYNNQVDSGFKHESLQILQKRNIITEEDFWKFLVNDETGPKKLNNYRNTDMTYDNIKTYAEKYKPFIEERRQIIEELNDERV